MKVLVTDPIANEGIEILRDAGIEVEEKLGLSPEELRQAIKGVHGLIIRSNTKVTADLVEAADELKVVGRAGTGLDNVDIPACNKHGIVVMNTPGGNTNSAAEHTIAMILAVSRHIPQATASMKEGKWEKKKFLGQEVAGKTLGIIGIGRIGSIVAQLAQGLKMKVVAFDPHIRPDLAERMGVELMDLDGVLARADYISVHTPLTPETKWLLNKDLFDKMKDGAIVVNCARGGIINEEDLYEALKSGKLKAAALDVFEKEPTTLENKLLSLENFICTPHLGASTKEAQENVAVAVARQIRDYLLNGEVRNAVNVPSVTGEALAQLAPYIGLGEKIGAFQAQILEGPIEEVEVIYQGDVAELDTKPVTIAMLKELLAPAVREDVNSVNAPIIAEERGIKVTESKSSTAEDFTNLITVKVKGGSEENIISGTIFGKKEPRLVRLNDFRLEAVPEGHMLLIYNEDRPGVIGRIGMTLGSAGINIARMQVGQDPSHKRNVILLTTNEVVSKEVLDNLLAQEGVTQARLLEL
ncbi:D-3-phosphoglycerate dehydrogenase [Dissulfuribacter thermophilus]|uniref:D-3-phosphoglycerate dehydrogenase n=1 Tax=Dissulfuribacter thermophilus TaxID=1156395 RepID=A0A1B9F735_9BACT|nr:phosphoglycerate dehydrogenase [Dissulfuribacter thermophilus]OCC15722.1 D-3-phosphoglycerate dehydrogenase [Dissulfuribacter thermophilus]